MIRLIVVFMLMLMSAPCFAKDATDAIRKNVTSASWFKGEVVALDHLKPPKYMYTSDWEVARLKKLLGIRGGSEYFVRSRTNQERVCHKETNTNEYFCVMSGNVGNIQGSQIKYEYDYSNKINFDGVFTDNAINTNDSTNDSTIYKTYGFMYGTNNDIPGAG